MKSFRYGRHSLLKTLLSHSAEFPPRSVPALKVKKFSFATNGTFRRSRRSGEATPTASSNKSRANRRRDNLEGGDDGAEIFEGGR